MSKVIIRLAPSAVIALCGAAIAVSMLSGCSMSDDTMGRFMVAPGKYVLYPCDALARQAQAMAVRKKELEELTAKAGTGAAGRVIAETTYGSEYIAVRGEINELRRAAAEKNCNPLPGIENPAGPASSSVIH